MKIFKALVMTAVLAALMGLGAVKYGQAQMNAMAQNLRSDLGLSPLAATAPEQARPSKEGKSAPKGFILWVNKYNHLMKFERMPEKEIPLALQDSEEGLRPILIQRNSLIYALAEKAFNDAEPAEAAEELGLTELALGRNIPAQVNPLTADTFEDRWNGVPPVLPEQKILTFAERFPFSGPRK